MSNTNTLFFLLNQTKHTYTQAFQHFSFILDNNFTQIQMHGIPIKQNCIRPVLGKSSMRKRRARQHK